MLDDCTQTVVQPDLLLRYAAMPSNTRMMLAANKLLVATAKLNKTSNGKKNDFAQYFDMFWGLVAMAY